MGESTTFIGLDVHQRSVMAAVWARDAAAPEVGPAPVELPKLVRWVQRIAGDGPVHVAYEAGPCGYPLVRALTQVGVRCTVVVPSLIPQVAGGRRQRIKTDRRDAVQLVTYLRQGLLKAVTVPSEADEALRELVRCRQQVQRDVVRARHRVSKLLLRHGHRWTTTRAWTRAYRTWVRALVWAEPGVALVCRTYLEALDSVETRLRALDAQLATWAVPASLSAPVAGLQCFRGIDRLTALTIAAETADGRRFPAARAYMHYTGLTCWEWSSADRRRQGGISKMGNTHLRRALVEAAWHYRYKPAIGRRLAQRQQGQADAVRQLAWRAQERLHHKAMQLRGRGKRPTVVTAAVARELAGFVWAVWHLAAPPALPAA
jgi:transposase